MSVSMVKSGVLVKKYRSLLKISQKEAAGNRMSHSMVSLIESGKIQLTTVTAMILADNFNKIASSKGIDLNLSLKDLLSNNNYYVEEGIRKSFKEAIERNASEDDYKAIFDLAKDNNCFEIMAEIKLTIGKSSEGVEDFNAAIDHYCKALEYFKLTENHKDVMETMIFIARCYNRLGWYDKSEDYLRRLKSEFISKYSDEYLVFQVNMELLYLLKNTNRNNEALKITDNLLKSKRLNNSNRKELLMLKVDIYLEEKKYTESINILKKLLTTYSTSDYKTLHKLAVAYLIIGSTQEGLSFLSQCIKYLNLNPREENTKILLMFADELFRYNIGTFSVKYYDYALVNSDIYNQYQIKFFCYKSLFNLFSKSGELQNFQSYAKKIEESICTSKNVEKLTHYILLLSQYYLKTSQEQKLHELLEKLEKVI